jgi:hypothetical protein
MGTVRERQHLPVTILALVMLAMPAWSATQAAPVPAWSIVTNPGRYGPYYHVAFDLTAKSVKFAESDRHVRDGGQFEIRLRAGQFPIQAPACRDSLVLRMPWTSSAAPAAAEKIRTKDALLKRIRELESNRNDTVRIVVELNPYVRVVSRSPLRVELTGCNLFFRHASGGYVDHVEPIASVR